MCKHIADKLARLVIHLENHWRQDAYDNLNWEGHFMVNLNGLLW